MIGKEAWSTQENSQQAFLPDPHKAWEQTAHLVGYKAD